jgi:predicted unusual protein kinase regulating ubiquinone biosynthesis (AarF/ABC1/UbiB family)
MTAFPQRSSKRRRARLRRREKLQLVADEAVERWQELHRAGEEEDDAVFRPLPRPPRLEVDPARGSALPAPPSELVFKAGMMHSIQRLFVWLYAAAAFGMRVLSDRMRGRDNEERRARRLRQTFESMGMTFIKFGQQLSMRLDLLPYAYTRELESMLDKVDPMPEDDAIRTIERALGRPIDEIFSAFDRTPIGSASVACVYHAVLISGEEVAVKVRRRRIGELLVADMRALGWLLKLADALFLRPGFTDNFRFELTTMLLEELDFRREARFGELFRRRMGKTRQLRFATAPKVYFDVSTADVLVTEFVTGTWMNEILTAIETDDAPALAALEQLDIDPIILARRIQLIGRYNNFENFFFHADLHPANILVQPGNKIVLVDFGSCGSFDRRELNSWRRWFEAQSVDDVGGMVQASLAIIEPIPAVDKTKFAQRLQLMFWNDLYAIKSKNSHWSERISARLWIGFMKLSREFGVSMKMNTLKMIRASMLADTIAARLDNDQDSYEEYRYYEKGAGRRARKRFFKRLNRVFGPGKFIRLEQGIESGLKLFHRVQQQLDSLAFIGILPAIGKAAKMVILLVKSFVAVAVGGGALALIDLTLLHFGKMSNPDHVPVRFFPVLWHLVIKNGWFQLVAILPIAVLLIRHVYAYLKEPEYERPR